MYLDWRLPSFSLLRSILHDMERQGSVVSGWELLGLRPAESDLDGLVGQVSLDKMTESGAIFNGRQSKEALAHDIRAAKESVVLFSGYVTPNRVAEMGDLLRSSIAKGVKVRGVIPPPRRNGSIPKPDGIRAVVDFRYSIHQKVCLIDNKIVWLGSLNPLSYAGKTDEIMTRVTGNGFAREMAARMSKLPISRRQASATVADAENPHCERCGGRSVFREGRYGPYFECEATCGWKENMKTTMRRAPPRSSR